MLSTEAQKSPWSHDHNDYASNYPIEQPNSALL